MAEKGAHLTQTVQIRPSVFDFVAQESLSELLYPSARRIVDVLSFRYNHLQTLHRWFDEYFLLTHFLLQFHYLKKYGGTFSESFYGLQRVPMTGKTKLLKGKMLVLSLLAVTIVPYLKLKLQKKAEKIYLDELPVATKREHIRKLKAVMNSISGFNISLLLLNFVQHLRYLSGHSDVNSPMLWVAQVKLQYMNDETTQQHIHIRDLIPQILRRSLEVGAFFMQFYQWWQSEQVGSFGSLPVPPPLQVNSQDGTLCPICHQTRHIDTALSVSGYVFCFTCITEALRENQCCPVTKLPATINNLIRLYPPDK